MYYRSPERSPPKLDPKVYPDYKKINSPTKKRAPALPDRAPQIIHPPLPHHRQRPPILLPSPFILKLQHIHVHPLRLPASIPVILVGGGKIHFLAPAVEDGEGRPGIVVEAGDDKQVVASVAVWRDRKSVV